MLIRALFAAALVAGLALSGCRPRNEGTVKVVVIGETPRLRDPNAGSLGAPDAVLIANIGQGLVRFDAAGQIEAGLAERWNVSNDGLSYIFRIAATQWSDGRKVTAHQVASVMRRALAGNSRNPLKDTLGAIEEIVPMTDRVLEFRLRAPRPNLLQLLAQPEMAIIRNGLGTGPFSVADKAGPNGEIRLEREVPASDGEDEVEEEAWLSATTAREGVKAFAEARADLLLGGTFNDLPLARVRRLPRGAMQYDPVSGLFGLLPLRTEGPLAEAEARLLLSQIIDRDAFVAGLDVTGLLPRATILQGGLEGVPNVPGPDWISTPIADRRAALRTQSDRLFGTGERPVVRVALPEGPGADFLLRLLQRDWGLLGLTVERAGRGKPADFRLVDSVAPSVSPAWFLRQFRCGAVPVCSVEADPLIEAARSAPVAVQRAALLNEAARIMDGQTLFIPLAAPVRWSLVSNRISGFAGNRFARHTLTGLQELPGSN